MCEIDKIKVGDAVECMCETSSNYGRVGEVMAVDGDIIHVVYDDGEKGQGKSKYYLLTTLKTSCETICKKKGIMSSIIEFANNMTLSANERLLRKYGLKNECGYTNQAISIVIDKLVADNEAYLISVATAKQTEDSAK